MATSVQIICGRLGGKVVQPHQPGPGDIVVWEIDNRKDSPQFVLVTETGRGVMVHAGLGSCLWSSNVKLKVLVKPEEWL